MFKMKNFDFTQWKRNCYDMCACIDVISEFLVNYTEAVNEIFMKFGNNNDVKITRENYKIALENYNKCFYDNYLFTFHWFKFINVNYEKQYGFVNFTNKVEEFDKLYKNNKIIDAISIDDITKLNTDNLTKILVPMYQDIPEYPDIYNIFIKRTKDTEFVNIFEMLNYLGTVVFTCNNDLKYIESFPTVACMNFFYRDEPLSFDQFFKSVNTMGTLDPSEADDDPNYDRPAFIFTLSSFDVNDRISKVYLSLKKHNYQDKLRDYFTKFAREFKYFLNDELIKNTRNILFK